MCTAIAWRWGERLFGRNLDYEHSFGEEVVLTPGRFPLNMGGAAQEHGYAILGMARVERGYPLYFDAMNEAGLCMAGLNFVGNVSYPKVGTGKWSVPQYALIPWVLRQCRDCREAAELLEVTRLTEMPFSPELPPAELHYMISDGEGTVVAEPGAEGFSLYPDPVEVLTNNPSFPQQLAALDDYPFLTPEEPGESWVPRWNRYSRGMGSLGLPGDGSSRSRFLRAAYFRHCSRGKPDGTGGENQMFRMLAGVAQLRGVCRLEDGGMEYTRYSCCMCPERLCYSYTTYDNPVPNTVAMTPQGRNSRGLIRIPVSGVE